MTVEQSASVPLAPSGSSQAPAEMPSGLPTGFQTGLQTVPSGRPRSGSRWHAIFMLVMVTLLWGISFPLMKFIHLLQDRHFSTINGADGLSDVARAGFVLTFSAALFFTALRFGLALVCLAVCLPRQVWRPRRQEWVAGTLIGLAFMAGFLPQLLGLQDIPASRSGFLTSLVAVFTPLLAMAWERQAPRPAVAMGIGLALMGTAILTGLVQFSHGLPHLATDATQQWGRGDLLTILGAALFAVQILLIDRYARIDPTARLTPAMLAAVTFVAATTFLGLSFFVPVVPVARVWWSLLTPSYFVITLVMSIACTVLAFAWMNRYQSHVSASQAAVIYTLEPVFATLWAMLLPDLLSPWLGVQYHSETLTWPLLLGGLLVMLGNFFALRPENRHEP